VKKYENKERADKAKKVLSDLVWTRIGLMKIQC
jgi:hypothetical protein